MSGEYACTNSNACMAKLLIFSQKSHRGAPANSYAPPTQRADTHVDSKRRLQPKAWHVEVGRKQSFADGWDPNNNLFDILPAR